MQIKTLPLEAGNPLQATSWVTKYKLFTKIPEIVGGFLPGILHNVGITLWRPVRTRLKNLTQGLRPQIFSFLSPSGWTFSIFLSERKKSAYDLPCLFFPFFFLMLYGWSYIPSEFSIGSSRNYPEKSNASFKMIGLEESKFRNFLQQLSWLSLLQYEALCMKS